MQSSAAIHSITTCLVGEMSSAKRPMRIGFQCGSSYSQTNPECKHGKSRVRESVMCGVMKSFWSAIIFEQQRFGHHRQKEKSHQTHQRRVEREVGDPCQRSVQHQNHEPQNRANSPAEHQLSRRSVSPTRRPKQRVRAELYCESQSSRDQHRVVLIDSAEVIPQYDCRDDYQRSGDSREEADRPRCPHRLAFRSSSSLFWAALTLRYML